MRQEKNGSNELGAYPGAYSGSTILYPKTLKLKPAGEAITGEEDEPSARHWIPIDDPGLEGLRPTDMAVTIAATPKTIANFARNEVPNPVVSNFWFSSISSKLSCSFGVSLEFAGS